MSIVHVSSTASLAAAILAKANNTTVSTKTLKKIEEVAARLYGVNNSGTLRPIASPLGKAAFLKDIKHCMNEVAVMPKGSAHRDLQTLLQRIETRTARAYDRLEKSFNRDHKSDLYDKFSHQDVWDMKNGVTNLENNFRLAYLLGSQGSAKPK